MTLLEKLHSKCIQLIANSAFGNVHILHGRKSKKVLLKDSRKILRKIDSTSSHCLSSNLEVRVLIRLSGGKNEMITVNSDLYLLEFGE